MSHSTLREVTLQTVANYSRAAEQAVDCYRAGGQRLIAAMQDGVDRVAERSTDYFVPRVVNAMRKASRQFGRYAVKGLDALSTQTERAIEFGKTGMSAQVERVASFTDRIDNPMVVSGVETAARLSMPGARAALRLSKRLAASAEKAHDKVAGAVPARGRKAKATTTTKKVVRKAAATVKRAARTVAAEVAPVRAPRARRAPKVVDFAAPETAAETATA